MQQRMQNKPIDARAHGILDYVFAGIQLIVPSVIGLSPTAIKAYEAIGLGFLAANALTDTPVGLKPVFSLQDHRKIDEVSLMGQSLLTFSPFIRNDKAVLSFHLGFLGAAIANYLLTDYDHPVKK